MAASQGLAARRASCLVIGLDRYEVDNGLLCRLSSMPALLVVIVCPGMTATDGRGMNWDVWPPLTDTADSKLRLSVSSVFMSLG